MSRVTSAPANAELPDGPTDVNVKFDAVNSRAYDLRSFLRTWCTEHNIAGAARDDAILVTTELFTNAVNATEIGSSVVVSVGLRPDAMVVSVSNVGKPFELESLPAPSIDRPGGRGLIIAQAVGTLSVSHNTGTTTVSAALPLGRQG